MRFLLFGNRGQVGFELQRSLAPLGEVLFCDQDQANFLEPAALRALVRSVQPHVIVNAAAYTAVDRAESEPDLCKAINAEAPALLADESRKCGSLLVHYSTDYVYGRSNNSPYLEDDATGPLSAYGRWKLAGDEAIQRSGARHLIFRTSWVYGARGQNFLRTMLRLGREKPELRIVSDQKGAPTWSRMIAEATALALSRALPDPDRYTGLYHLSAGGETSWYGFAKAIFEHFDFDPKPKLIPISTDEYPTPAKRPAYSVLSNEKFSQVFSLKLPDWQDQLALVAAEIKEQAIASPGLVARQQSL